MPTTPTQPAALTLAALTAALVAAGLPASAEVVRTGQTALTSHLLVTIAERVADAGERQRLSSAVQLWQAGHLAPGRYDVPDAQVALDVDALGSHREGAYRCSTLRDLVALLARGRAARAIADMADECGLSVDEWHAETRREMDAAARSARGGA